MWRGQRFMRNNIKVLDQEKNDTISIMQMIKTEYLDVVQEIFNRCRHSALFPLSIAHIVIETIILQLNATVVQINMKEG